MNRLDARSYDDITETRHAASLSGRATSQKGAPMSNGSEAATQNGATHLEDQQTIAELRAEVARLSNRAADDLFARELRETFTLATFAGAIASPFGNSRLLRMIIETASYFLSAQAASLFLIDEQRQELVVACALGPKAALVEQIRVPLGHGIAGLVAVSGQAMAIADVVDDPRHAADVSRILGHVPQSILCVPLLHNDQVIGVLELLDKEDAPTFSAEDIEALGMFADQAAVAIEQSRTLQHLATLISEVLASSGESADHQRLRKNAHEFAQRIEENATYRRSLELAQLVQEIGRYGDHELDSCRTILGGFADYLRSSARPLGGVQ